VSQTEQGAEINAKKTLILRPVQFVTQLIDF